MLGHSHLASSLSQILFISKLLISAISLAATWISAGKGADNVISKPELGFLRVPLRLHDGKLTWIISASWILESLVYAGVFIQ